MTFRHLPALALLLGLVALVGGCGSDSEATGGQATTSALNEDAKILPKDEYIAKGSAVCAKLNKAQGELFEEARQRGEKLAGNGVLSTAQETELREELVSSTFSNIKEALDELAAIGYPEGDERFAQALLDEYEDALTVSEAAPDKYFEGKSFKAVGKSAEAYGLKGCRF